MQDKETGTLIELKEENLSTLNQATNENPTIQEMIHQQPFDPEKISERLTASGYCVLQLNEVIFVKEKPFVVQKFDKKSILLKPTNAEKVGDMGFKTGEQIFLKNGNFVVSSFGVGALILRGIAGTSTFNGKVIEEFRKKQLKNAIKANKE